MNARILLIILTLIAGSCLLNPSDQKKSDIKGRWVSENISSDFIHAHVRFPFTDSSDLEKHRIASNFEIQFEDWTFQTEEIDGMSKSGTYKLNGDTLILHLEGSSHHWLKYTVESLTDEVMKLQTSRVYFQTVEGNDSIDYMTGENVKMTFKKK